MITNKVTPYGELIFARKHMQMFLSMVMPGTFWHTIVKFCEYLLLRAEDSLSQGSLDTLPEYRPIDLQIEDLFGDESAS